jgi:hypothetical protein
VCPPFILFEEAQGNPRRFPYKNRALREQSIQRPSATGNQFLTPARTSVSSSEESPEYSLIGALKMMEEAAVSRKNCPICSLDLPLSEFGVCRARKDGRNLYCKSCIRKKVTDSRRALKEYRSARKRYVSQPLPGTSWPSQTDGESPSLPYTRLLSKLSPVERVKEAIRKGARTQREIAQETRLGKDEIGDAIANLLLWTREIKTQVVDNIRLYFINESAGVAIREEALNLPERKGDVPSSFSAIQGLMPGRNPEGEEPEKIGGWVAA